MKFDERNKKKIRISTFFISMATAAILKKLTLISTTSHGI
jgi:hypothetical protein